MGTESSLNSAMEELSTIKESLASTRATLMLETEARSPSALRKIFEEQLTSDDALNPLLNKAFDAVCDLGVEVTYALHELKSSMEQHAPRQETGNTFGAEVLLQAAQLAVQTKQLSLQELSSCVMPLQMRTALAKQSILTATTTVTSKSPSGEVEKVKTSNVEEHPKVQAAQRRTLIDTDIQALIQARFRVMEIEASIAKLLDFLRKNKELVLNPRNESNIY